MHGLISFHVATVNPELYSMMHPGRQAGDLENILSGVRKLLDTGYPADQMLNSVTFTGLQSADDMIETIDYFEENFGIRVSLNVYHTYLRPGMKDDALQRFIPDEESVKKVYERYSRLWNEKELPMNCVNKQYCSATIAVLCNGYVTPCATIRDTNADNIHTDGGLFEIVNRRRDYLIFKQFKNIENLPETCRQCSLASRCWGCRSRSYAANLGMFGKDPRCFRNE